jgi:Tol biopolymer transport system component
MVDAREPELGSGRRRTKGLAAGLLLVAGVVGLAWTMARLDRGDPILQPVPLTTDPGMENWPTFSPDGSQVAFQGDVQGGGGAIFVKEIGQDASLRLTFPETGIDHAVSWSPDGRWIAFLRAETSPSGPLRLMVVRPTAGPEREISTIDAPAGWGFRPAWTPDSRALIVPDREGATPGYVLHRISIDDGSRSRWISPGEEAAGDGDLNPAISPDGARMAFTRDGDLHQVGIDGQSQVSGQPRGLAAAAELGRLWGLAWTPDSRDLVVAAGRWPWARLYRVSGSGDRIRPLTSLGVGAFAPAVSPTGSRLAYLEWITASDIWRLRVDGDGQSISEPTRLVGSSRLDFNPAHSPDGERLAFLSNRTGSYGVWLASPLGEDAGPLRLVGGAGEPLTPGPPSWSPDQKAIVFASDGDLYVHQLPSGPSRALTTGPALDESPLWSPDGRWVFFSSRRGGSWQVLRMPAEGGEAVLLTQGGGRLRAVSPDGLRLYYVRDQKLWAIPSEGGGPLEILESAPDAVAVTEQGLYYAANVPTSIQYLDLGSRRVTRVLELDRWLMGLSVSPDGDHLLYGLLDHRRTDLMLIENFE